MFKVGDIVRCISTGDIGRVSEIMETDTWYSNVAGVFRDGCSTWIKVRFFDLPKRYSGLYSEDAFELHTTEEKIETNALTSWMATPNEKLRNVLVTKELRNRRNNQKRIRLDGR